MAYEFNKDRVYVVRGYDKTRSLEHGVTVGENKNTEWDRITVFLHDCHDELTRIQLWNGTAVQFDRHLRYL